jgi:urea transporter
MFMAPVLFVVRWNVVNGKAAALGCTIAAINSASIALKMDNYAFVLRGWYAFSAAFLLAALHLAFNANPMLTAAVLAEKEKAKAAKRA